VAGSYFKNKLSRTINCKTLTRSIIHTGPDHLWLKSGYLLNEGVALNVIRESIFPWPVRLYGLLGLLGATVFLSSLIVLHIISSGIDWTSDYVSYLANGPYGWIFISGAFVHGWGNLALTLGLRSALHPGRLRTWAVSFFGLATVGILVASLFPIDPPDQVLSTTGLIHRAAASSIFFLELVALFIFSVAFSRDHRWCRQQPVSLFLSVIAAVALAALVVALFAGVVPGLAERAALSAFMVWELWAYAQLIRGKPVAKAGE